MRVLSDHDRRDAAARAGVSGPVSRLALWLGAPVLFAALVLSYSRASLLNLFVALAALLYMERAEFGSGRLLAIAASCLAAGSLAAWQLFPEAAWNYWLHLVHSQFLFTQPESVLSGRVASWQTIAAFLAAHPWHAILGIGYKTLPYSDFIGHSIVADNMYLSLLVETGIVGLAAFFLLNFAILRTAWRAARRDDSRASFFGTWIFCFWIGQLFQMLSGDLFTYWRVLPVYFWVLAMAARRPRQVPVRRLLILDQFNQLGGAQRCLLDLLPAFLEAGYETHLAVPGDGPLADGARSLGAVVHRIPCGAYTSGQKSWIDAARFGVDLPRQACTHCVSGVEARIDLIYVNGPRLLPAAAIGARGRPVVFHAHSVVTQEAAARLTRWALRSANASVIAACRFVLESLAGVVEPERSRVIYNGVAPVECVRRRRALTIPGELASLDGSRPKKASWNSFRRRA
jgi:hypothetical protein